MDTLKAHFVRLAFYLVSPSSSQCSSSWLPLMLQLSLSHLHIHRAKGGSLSVSPSGCSCSASHFSLSDPACSTDCGDVTPVLIMMLQGSVAAAVGACPVTPSGPPSIAVHACSQCILNSSTCISLQDDNPACWHLLSCAKRELEGPSGVASDQ